MKISEIPARMKWGGVIGAIALLIVGLVYIQSYYRLLGARKLPMQMTPDFIVETVMIDDEPWLALSFSDVLPDLGDFSCYSYSTSEESLQIFVVSALKIEGSSGGEVIRNSAPVLLSHEDLRKISHIEILIHDRNVPILRVFENESRYISVERITNPFGKE